jgi:cytochrome b561
MMDLIWPITTVGIMVVGVLIGILVVWRMLIDRRSGFPRQDERTQKVAGKAASYALLIGTYFTLGLTFVNLISLELFDSPILETGYALIASVLVYSLSFIGLRWYLDKKGEF